MLAALIQAGAPREVIEAARGRLAHDEHFEVWPENWQSLLVFSGLTTSWTWVSAGLGTPVRVGIPATELAAAVQLHGIKRKKWQSVHADIRAMEAAALQELSE